MERAGSYIRPQGTAGARLSVLTGEGRCGANTARTKAVEETQAAAWQAEKSGEEDKGS